MRKQTWDVTCARPAPLTDRKGTYWCGFRSYRRAASKPAAEAKPCPRCGGAVVAVAPLRSLGAVR